MSNTNQPPLHAWTFLESSKNVSASLREEEKKNNYKKNHPDIKWTAVKKKMHAASSHVKISGYQTTQALTGIIIL